MALRGEPAYSKQPIISLPENPDNSRQTIVNPAAPKLIPHSVKLPNLVVATPAPQPPVAGATRSPSQLTVPWLAAAPVPPPEENTSRRLSDLNLQGHAPSVVEPPPDLASVERKLGDINVAHAEPQIEAPKLPVPEQRASAGGGQGAQAVPAPPPASVGGSGLQSAGQLIALGLDPAPAAGPIEVPAGNRRGIFAATPEGKPGAPGLPEIAASGTGPGGTAKGGAGGPGDRKLRQSGGHLRGRRTGRQHAGGGRWKDAGQYLCRRAKERHHRRRSPGARHSPPDAPAPV